MSHVHKFQTQLTAKVKASVSGIDPILIWETVQLFLDILGKCRSPERVKELASQPSNPWTRRAARKAVRAAKDNTGASIGQAETQKFEELVIQQCAECSEQDIDDLMNEIEANETYLLI